MKLFFFLCLLFLFSAVQARPKGESSPPTPFITLPEMIVDGRAALPVVDGDARVSSSHDFPLPPALPL